MIVQKHHEVMMIEWPAFNDDGALDNFRGDSASFRFNQKKNSFNRRWWHKKCWNNDSIEFFF